MNLDDTSIPRLRFTSSASLVLAAVTIAFVALELVDSIVEGFDAFVLIPGGIQLGLAAAVGLAGLALRRVAARPARDDLSRALLALRIYFAVHGILFILGFAIGTLTLLFFFFAYGI